MPKLAAGYASGKVAVVNGVGNPAGDLSHFSSMATWMAGTAGTSRATGWLGRFVDTLPDGAQGMRAAAVGCHHAAAPGGGALERHLPRRAERAVRLLHRRRLAPPGVCRGAVHGRVLHRARRARRPDRRPGVPHDHERQAGPDGGLGPRRASRRPRAVLDTAARLINLNLGVRVVQRVDPASRSTPIPARRLVIRPDSSTSMSRSTGSHSMLAPSFAGRVVLMTFSEFGRRAKENGAAGTDHGTAGPMLVVGNRVAGGMYGSLPSLTKLDANGNLAVTVDFRRVYAGVLHDWLRADPATVLGGSYTPIPLFRSGPG